MGAIGGLILLLVGGLVLIAGSRGTYRTAWATITAPASATPKRGA